MATKELALFLAHSLELEAEARERYEELADVMAQHHNREVAGFFQRMAREAEHHQAEVAGLAAGTDLPPLKPWEYLWPEAEPPETTSYEVVHYRMSLGDAMRIALGSERRAHAFYRQAAEAAADAETAAIAARFAKEELSHAAELERMLAALPEDATHHREDDDPPHMPE